MDFVKREDNNIVEEENYRAYLEAVQKTHQVEVTDYQHTAISMEQLHQAMQTSLNASSIVHNLQLPISPRQMSTLMLKTNHITRNLNFNDIPAHLQRNITEVDLAQPLTNEIAQNLGRHDELIINQNLARNLDINLARTIANDLELQNALPNSLVQNLSEQELNTNLAPELGHPLNRLNDVNLSSQQIVRTENNISQSISNEIALSHHLIRQNSDQNLISNEDEVRRTPDGLASQNILEQHINQRLEQHLGHRLENSIAQRLDQRLDQILAQRVVNAVNMHEHQRQLENGDHLLPMDYQIKVEQEDDGYFYANMGQGVSSNGDVNGHIPLQGEHQQTNVTNVTQDVFCVYNNQMISVPALNPIDLYTRPQNYFQNYTSNSINRDNPQNLVVHKQFESSSQFPDEFKKLRQDGVAKDDGAKSEEPKENLKPSDQNKMYYDYGQSEFSNNSEKNENDPSSHNKLLSLELAMNIRGEYVCYKCSEIFPSKRALKQHGKMCEFANNKDSIEKQGKFTCTQCAYRCQSPAILKIHERTHSGEKPYSCTFCDYKSGQKNNVAKHILVHMKEKPFRCQYCDYRCAQKNNLVVHERTHTGYKPFACPYCEYRTVQKPNLVKHMYLHTDQKPFSCDMCNYRCVQKTNLTKHKQRHLNDKGDKLDPKVKPYRPRQKSFKCPHCTYRCVQKTSLEKHLQFKHTDVQTEFVQLEQGLNLMKHDEISDVQNLSVKKDQCVQEVLEPLQMQS